MLPFVLVLGLFFLSACEAEKVGAFNPKFGVFLGTLPSVADGEVSGRVYVINATALQVVNFNYNGAGPDVFFWLDRSEEPAGYGIKIPSQEFGRSPLGEYKNKHVVLRLPGRHKIQTFKSFGLLCYQYTHNFGSVIIPRDILARLENGKAEKPQRKIKV